MSPIISHERRFIKKVYNKVERKIHITRKYIERNMFDMFFDD